jgi:hypothetical protein
MVVFGDQENSPELEIIEVKKRDKSGEPMENGYTDETKKRQKLD